MELSNATGVGFGKGNGQYNKKTGFLSPRQQDVPGKGFSG